MKFVTSTPWPQCHRRSAKIIVPLENYKPLWPNVNAYRSVLASHGFVGATNWYYKPELPGAFKSPGYQHQGEFRTMLSRFMKHGANV